MTLCIPCRLMQACISSKNSTNHVECWLILTGLPSLMLHSISCPLVTSAVRCRLPNCHSASPVANCLLWVPLSNSYWRPLAYFRPRRDLESRPLFGFAPKQTKRSSAWRTPFIVSHPNKLYIYIYIYIGNSLISPPPTPPHVSILF